jgi:phage N-6-adenine-methyltransferase
MANINNHASKSNKDFRDFTQKPKWFFEAFNHRFNYNLDGAALPVSALCKRFITPKQNSLKKDWSLLLADEQKPAVWVNPPYSDILPWVNKGVEQREKGVFNTLLVPHENRAQWWPYERASEIWDIVGYYKDHSYKSGPRKNTTVKKWVSGGIKFVNAKTGIEEKNELNKAMCLIIFDPMHIGPCIKRTIRKDVLMAIGKAALAKQKKL